MSPKTYAARSYVTTLKNSLYDTYKLAIRWASDRIDKQGDRCLRNQRLLDRQ